MTDIPWYSEKNPNRRDEIDRRAREIPWITINVLVNAIEQHALAAEAREREAFEAGKSRVRISGPSEDQLIYRDEWASFTEYRAARLMSESEATVS